MHSGTEVMIVGNDGIDGRGMGMGLVNDGVLADVLMADSDCLPLYPFRFWCLPEEDKADGRFEDVCREGDAQLEIGLDVYTDAVGTEGPEFL